MHDRVLRILLVSDLEDWILTRIARHLAQRLEPRLRVKVLISHAQGFRRLLFRIRRQFDVVHFLSPWDYFTYKDVIDRPCVVSLWHMVNWEYFTPHAERLDALLAGSSQWLKWAQPYVSADLPRSRMTYGLETDVFVRSPDEKGRFLRENGLSPETLVFGFAGSSWSDEGHRKNLETLWACMSRVLNHLRLPAALRITGRGWTPDMVPEELKRHVFICGFIPFERMPAFYSSLDFYLCVSSHEGVPYPVIESMSCRCVMLSTPVGIVPEIIVHGKNGFILDVDNLVDHFTNIIASIAGDKNLVSEIGSSARETVSSRLNWDAAVSPSHFLDIYRAAIGRYRSRKRLQRIAYFMKAEYLSILDYLYFKLGADSWPVALWNKIKAAAKATSGGFAE